MGERYPAPESGGVARCWQTHDTTGNYVPSSSEWVHDQVEVSERSGGREGNEIMGRPIVVVTFPWRQERQPAQEPGERA
jgi:hypothetical protein